jgi:hypothetical protein
MTNDDSTTAAAGAATRGKSETGRGDPGPFG